MKNKIILTYLILSLFLPFSPSWPIIPDVLATEITSTDVPKLIPNLTTITSSLTIIGLDIISDINVVVNLTHSFVSDLDIFLVSPDSTRIELSTGNGGDGQNYSNTVFDDEADTFIINGSAPFTGTYQPEGSLSSLDELPADGTWILEISDNWTEDTGELLGWSLVVTTVSGDADNDGVTDDIDQCPDTPALATVDANGCADSQKDTDGDGVTDDIDNCPLVFNNDQSDTDEDGVGDVCDDFPNDGNYTTDTDDDGLPDGWEEYYFSDLDEIGSGDPDEDGFPNTKEFQCGSDPSDSTSTCARGLPWLLLLLDQDKEHNENY